MMNFTAVGDTVNLAARLQSLSGNGRILISEATRDGLHQGIRTEFIGRRGVKGRLEAVMMYEVMG
jgi:adenylate cyclase